MFIDRDEICQRGSLCLNSFCKYHKLLLISSKKVVVVNNIGIAINRFIFAHFKCSKC